MYTPQSQENVQFPQPSSPTVELRILQSSTQVICQRQNNLNSVLQDLTNMLKHEQISFPMKDQIDPKIEEYTTEFTALFNDVRQLLARGEQLQSIIYAQSHQHLQPQLQQTLDTLDKVWKSLISMSLTITKHPDAILQKGNRIETEIRLLLGNISSPIAVRVRIIDMADAESLKMGRIKRGAISSQGTIENDRQNLTAQGSHSVSKCGSQLVLKEIGNRKKTSNGQRKTVTELKCVLLYELEPNEEIQRLFGWTETIWTVSFPIILVTHSKQLKDAYATIVWDRAFGNQNTVKWPELASALRTVFAHLSTSRKRYLTEKDLDYFRTKMNINDGNVSFHQVCKMKIGSKGFSFWTWLYSCCNLIQTTLLPYWENGYILGFSSGNESMKILSNLERPAFILRFSDSELGVLALSFFTSSNNGTKVPYQCLLNEVLSNKTASLAALLKDFNPIRFTRYICLADYKTIDKQLFFDDKQLAVETVESGNGLVNGYHKIRLGLALTLQNSQQSEEDRNEGDMGDLQNYAAPVALCSNPSPQQLQAPPAACSRVLDYGLQQHQNDPMQSNDYGPMNCGYNDNFGSNHSPFASDELTTPVYETLPFTVQQQQPINVWQQPNFHNQQDQRSSSEERIFAPSYPSPPALRAVASISSNVVANSFQQQLNGSTFQHQQPVNNGNTINLFGDCDSSLMDAANGYTY